MNLNSVSMPDESRPVGTVALAENRERRNFDALGVEVVKQFGADVAAPALIAAAQDKRHTETRLPVARETVFQTRISDVLVFAVGGALVAARKLKTRG